MYITAAGVRLDDLEMYVAPDGTQYPPAAWLARMEELGITVQSEPAPPADYDPEFYVVEHTDTAPYVTYTRKPKEQIAAMMWERIKALRDAKTLAGGCRVEIAAGTYKWFHSDTHSKVQQLALVMAGAILPAGIQWKTMDGSFVEMTPGLAAAIYLAQMTQEQAIFAYAESLRATVFAADMPGQVVISTGWPAIYGAA